MRLPRAPVWRLAWTTLWATALGGLLGACAQLQAPVPEPVAAAASEAAPSAGHQAFPEDPDSVDDPRRIPRLTVQAPGPLKALLETYLDLARTAALPGAGRVSEVEWSRLVAAAPEQAVELAKTEGYFSAHAELQRTPAEGDRAPGVTLLVSPGPQVKVGKLTLELQGDLAEADSTEATNLRGQIERRWPLSPGEGFSGEVWADAKSEVLAQLRAAGYVAASWSGTAAEIDVEHDTVRIFVVADSGPLYQAGTIEVSGLQRHDAAMVRGQAGFKTGDALTEARLQDYQERLSKIGLFDQVSVSLDPDTTRAASTTVLVRVIEAKQHSATTSVGVSATTGPRVGLEHLNRRLFGYALSARSKIEWGRDRQALEAEVSTHPDEQLERKIYSVSEERLYTAADMVMSQRLRLGRLQDRPRLERLYFVETERAEQCDRDGDQLSNCEVLRALSVNSHSTWRRVDNVLLPTEGYTLSTQLGTGVSAGGERRGAFGRVYGRATGYWPLGDWHSQARLELGKVLTMTGVAVPDSLRFRAGGDNSVRGYPWRTLAPTSEDGSISGGLMLVTASLELAHPIVASLPTVWGATFIDAGRAADHVGDLKPALGYGIGVRWRSPVGPLSLDWAWGQELHRGRLHLNVGVAF